MNNQVNLSDDELSVIQTSLQLSLTSFEKYVITNGEHSLDYQTKEVYKDMQSLFDRLNKEYF
jgi:hypothetical protein